MKKAFYIILLLFNLGTVSAQDSLLENSVSKEELFSILAADEHWISYPSYQDREKWEHIATPEIRQNIISEGEKALSHIWKPDLATDYLAYKRTGEILTGRKNHMALISLTLAELVEGKGRFMDAIINGAWFLCETSWVHSAHAYFQKDQSGLPDPDEPTVELVVADIGAQMAWTYHFFKDEFNKVSPLISKRIKKTVIERLIDPYFSRTDYWWMGLHGEKNVNNWNIWINYNVLQAVMLLDDDKRQKAEHVYQLMRSVDRYIDVQHEDGACEEGPTYWGHAGANLVKFLDLLYRITDGSINIFNQEKIQNIGKYIYRVHIYNRYFVSFSDAGAVCNINSGAVYHYGKCIGDPVMTGFASDFARISNWATTLHRGSIFARVLDDIVMSKEILEGKGCDIDFLSYYFKDSELCVARDGKKLNAGFFFAAHGSHNNVPHNHNDVGSCMLYYNGLPVLIDVGVGRYTRKTFSSERYSIWTMQSCYHNLPTINGHDQHNGEKFKATDVHFKDTKQSTWFSADIANAYVAEANIKSWIRTYQLKRKKEFIISDRWLLNKTTGETVLNFMTACDIEEQEGSLFLKRDDVRIQIVYDKKQLSPTIETIKIDDSSLLSSWTNGILYRIRFSIINPQQKGKCKISLRPINQ